jgi:hypothetical protein
MLSWKSLQGNRMYYSHLTRRLFNGGRAFCLKVLVKKTLFFTSTDTACKPLCLIIKQNDYFSNACHCTPGVCRGNKTHSASMHYAEKHFMFQPPAKKPLTP